MAAVPNDMGPTDRLNAQRDLDEIEKLFGEGKIPEAWSIVDGVEEEFRKRYCDFFVSLYKNLDDHSP